MGFIDNDNEYVLCLEEAQNSANSFQMRELFANILLNCTPSDPGRLWEKFKIYLAYDILFEYRKIDPDLQLNETFYNLALIKVNAILSKSSSDISKYANMPTIDETAEPDQEIRVNKLINDEINLYDIQK